jgi:hypothetical protein
MMFYKVRGVIAIRIGLCNFNDDHPCQIWGQFRYGKAETEI